MARSLLRRAVRKAAPHLPFDVKAVHARSRRAAREAVAGTVRWSGLAAARRTMLRHKIGILVYHNPDAATFERHLGYLAQRYTLIPLDRLVDAIRSGAVGSLPQRSLVITIDDGHRGNRELLDVISRYDVVPTLYACTQIVGTGRRFWWTAAAWDWRERLFAAPNDDRLALLREHFAFEQGSDSADGTLHALSAADIAAMAGRIDIQSHTRFHPVLPNCIDAEAELEIRGSKQEAEALTGRPCVHFSYPNGRYTEREIELVRTAGFVSARTVDIGWNDGDTDPFRLRAIGTMDDASVNVLAAQLAGLPLLKDLIYR